jgi:hypothetical protein
MLNNRTEAHHQLQTDESSPNSTLIRANSCSPTRSINLTQQDDNTTLTLTTPRKKQPLAFNPIAKTTTAPSLALKRNLFGVPLDHDQLRHDLQVMCKEQLEVKKHRWNFDFEKLKPVPVSEVSSAVSGIKWKSVQVNYAAELDAEYDMTEAALNAAELATSQPSRHFRPLPAKSANGEISIFCETLDQVDSESSTIPRFYQYQRRYKLNENKNRVNLNVAELPISFGKNKKELTKPKCTVQTTLGNDENGCAIVKPTFNTVVAASSRKPRSLKRSTQLDSKSRIITFSENRKDTLRSATSSVSASSSCTQVNTVSQSARSAFTSKAKEVTVPVAGMKQRCLLDMLKQRKPRRVNLANDCGLNGKAGDENSTTTGHFLRSQSANSRY